jgi:methylase of polypeptide subunit release factors
MGTVMFNGLALMTAPGRMMTPRAVSEQLGATARARLARRLERVADVGTGSGAKTPVPMC